MSEIKINAISKDGYTLGEGPHWNEEDQTLLSVDILHGNIHRYFLQTQRMQNAHIDDGGTDTTVSFIIPVEGAKDTFVIGLRTSVALIKWCPTEPDNQIIKPIPLLALDSTQAQRVKFNDAKCDNKGRLYVGTMDTDFRKNMKNIWVLFTLSILTSKYRGLRLTLRYRMDWPGVETTKRFIT
ncbi:Regucalcin [Armadillidium vulgare]|nr:Regucalcin [Armadillidium vulgare]